jgi:hypothetical protein
LAEQVEQQPSVRTERIVCYGGRSTGASGGDVCRWGSHHISAYRKEKVVHRQVGIPGHRDHDPMRLGRAARVEQRTRHQR